MHALNRRFVYTLNEKFKDENDTINILLLFMFRRYAVAMVVVVVVALW